MVAASSVERWERWITVVPFGALVVATAAAMAAGPSLGTTTPTARLIAQLTLAVVAAVYLWWFTVARPELSEKRPWSVGFYVGRTALALALTLLNPLFCIFAWVGYIDAHVIFRGRARWLALGFSAAIMATGQSGRLPLALDGQAALWVVLLVVNLGLATVFASYGNSMAESNSERAATISELERLNAELEEALAENAQLHETVIVQARSSGVQQERQRLAREIHDTIAQSLAGVLAQLQAAHEETDPAAVRARMGRARELTREALAEARRSVMNMVPEPLSASSLPEAVSALVSSWGATNGVRAQPVLVGEPRPLHPEVEATVLRITQEALTNVIKHASASRVRVTLTYDDDEVVLDVRDDGVGFDPEGPTRPTSFGLRGMRQRTDRLAGTLEVEAAPGAGTAISVRLPALERSAA